jgi:hypothetical protein
MVAENTSGTLEDGSLYRVTFLVNVWLHHHPAGIQPLPGDLRDYLRAKEQEIGLAFPTELPATSYIHLVPSDAHTGAAPLKITSKKITDDNGEWLNIPFVSDDSDWGKSDEEAGIFLSIWLPNEILQGSTTCPTFLAATKSRLKSGTASTDRSTSTGTSVELIFNDEECAARLEYEADEDAEEEFAEEVGGALDMTEDS